MSTEADDQSDSEIDIESDIEPDSASDSASEADTGPLPIPVELVAAAARQALLRVARPSEPGAGGAAPKSDGVPASAQETSAAAVPSGVVRIAGSVPRSAWSVLKPSDGAGHR